jgi:hypothetical protein
MPKKNDEGLNRREFLKKAAKRSAVLAGTAAAAHLPYKKPSVNSFFGVKKAYAQQSNFGQFTLNLAHYTPPSSPPLIATKHMSPTAIVPITLVYGRPDIWIVTIEKIELYNGTGWITIFSGSAPHDNMIEGGWPTLSGLPVPPGTYSKVRITNGLQECFKGQLTYESITYYTTDTQSATEYLPVQLTGPALLGCITWTPGEEVRTYDIDPVAVGGPSDVIEKCLLYTEENINNRLWLYYTATTSYFQVNGDFPTLEDCP